MRRAPIAAALLPALAAAADAPARQFDLHCTGATAAHRPAAHWFSIDTGADHWCARPTRAGACLRQDFTADDATLSATQDDEPSWAVSIDRTTGHYSWRYVAHGREQADEGSCAALPFTPYPGAPHRPAAPPPPGQRF